MCTGTLTCNVHITSQLLGKVRAAFASGRTRSYESRVKNLEAFMRMIEENGEEIADALHQDLRKVS